MQARRHAGTQATQAGRQRARRAPRAHSEVMMLPNDVSVMMTSMMRSRSPMMVDASDCRMNLTMSLSRMSTSRCE